MNFLGPDDNCPRCTAPTSAEASAIDGVASYQCPKCLHAWTTGWHTGEEPRPPARARELMLEDPSRFTGEDTEGRYVYDDEPGW